MHRIILMLTVGLGVVVLMSGTALASQGEPAAVPTKPVTEPKVHIVESGDSLSLIAQSEALETWRPLWDANAELENPDLIYAGQKLVVPVEPLPERPLPAAIPAPTPQPGAAKVSSAQRMASVPANYAAGVPGLLERIRLRESGGNYAINTGNGYYGAYQFNLGTWRGVGGTGLPSEASPAEQDMRAQMLYERRGCSPWPNTCR